MNGRACIRRILRVSLQCLLLCAATMPGAIAWGAHSSQAPAAAQATEGMVTRGDLEIVECLLPGQVRSLGTSTYLSQRRPVRTTTSDCRIRGGEFVAYDRADYKSALRIWMQAAEAGDVEAQNNVGEIYERGLGDVPNYAAAAIWYQKAADQHYSRALFNLGTLYEAGLGVDQDQLKALNLYRQAWGLPADSVMFESAARREQETLRAELTQAVSEKDLQLQLLKKQLQELQSRLEAAAAAAAQAAAAARPAPAPAAAAPSSAEVETLRKLVAQLETERQASQQRLDAVPRTREPAAGAPVVAMSDAATARSVNGLDFGRYYALIIGNQNYSELENLLTPRSDAERVAKLLKEKYGFTVQMIEDGTDVTMLRALNDLNGVLRPNDNLLIYYAGHGTRLVADKRESGYWLPVNAERPPKDTFWVPNEQITAHIGRMAARRVLVVADSCYAGLLSADPSFIFLEQPTQVSADYIKFKLPKRARLLIDSGGDEPVLDSGGLGNSVFASAFLAVLEQNEGVLSAPALFAGVQERVKLASARLKFAQQPELKSIKGAGHEVGDFFFVPLARSRL
ncbi:MAG TPA: caspase family protein [Steroidobacteraceae bacterium]|nr:caspase family protein [Steroidobacteraceae bacterium]